MNTQSVQCRINAESTVYTVCALHGNELLALLKITHIAAS